MLLTYPDARNFSRRLTMSFSKPTAIVNPSVLLRVSGLALCTVLCLLSVTIALGLAASSAQANILYLASQVATNHQVVEINSIGAASVFASLPAGAVYPNGVAFDVSGNLYATDPVHDTITKITPAGTVSLFKSLPGGSFPTGLAIDAGGDLYVANSSTDQINRITSTGTLSLFATLPGEAPSSEGLAFDAGGNLYVSRSNGEIHKITSSGTVSLFVTLPPGSDPIGLAFDGIGNLYAADGNSEKINRITPGGAVSLFATLPFPEAWGLAFGTTGILYATDLSGDVHKIAPDGTVSLFASVAAESFLYLAVTDDAGHPLSLPPATLLGDYNRNGTVDAADYVVWRKGLGTVYNQADYQIWRNHFGQTSGVGSSASANAAVPEPSSLVICGTGLVFGATVRRFKTRSRS
jgi:sugar lactone lactonase YvrE